MRPRPKSGKSRLKLLFGALPLLFVAQQHSFATYELDPPFRIQRIAGAVRVDGILSEPAWQSAHRVETWYETRPGDNLEPRVKNVAYLAYDSEFFYIGFDLEDPAPERIRAPLGDRDDVPPHSDCVGVVLLAGEGEKTGQEFVVNPRGIQWDGIISDVTGEDATPDFFWDSAAKINSKGWTAEMRIPFATLRYKNSEPDQWRILMYRNHPREYRYEYFSSKVPRERACLICNARSLSGLTDLPSGGHWVVAPYVSASQDWAPEGRLGSSLAAGDGEADAGFDAKWVPNPDTALDATVYPDFSQIESDVAQITANERFALSYPEKRPFFMEGADLFSTPIQAVHTRTFTSPRWGARATGSFKDTKYTLLLGQDRGGGYVILPGPYGSSLAPQDFQSGFAVARVRHDIGRSVAGFLFTDREYDVGGYNRLAGPDFEIRPTEQDIVGGQYLLSWTLDPWGGTGRSGGAGLIRWSRATGKWDHYLLYKDVSEEFRADNGFVPSAGYRARYGEFGRTFWPQGKPITRLRLFTFSEYDTDYDGNAMYKGIVPGFGFDALLDSFVRFEFHFEDVRSGGEIFYRRQIRPTIQFSPGRAVPRISFEGIFGDEVDFLNNRPGRGTTLKLTTELRPTNHLQLSTTLNRRWLDVDLGQGTSAWLFTADVARLRAMYTFTDRIWLRLIGQWVQTRWDSGQRVGHFSGSAVVAYRLNWQTVAYAGYSDLRAIDVEGDLERAGRALFFKISYAFRG